MIRQLLDSLEHPLLVTSIRIYSKGRRGFTTKQIPIVKSMEFDVQSDERVSLLVPPLIARRRRGLVTVKQCSSHAWSNQVFQTLPCRVILKHSLLEPRPTRLSVDYPPEKTLTGRARHAPCPLKPSVRGCESGFDSSGRHSLLL